MAEAIGIRLSKEVLEKIEKISKEDISDRSTTIRKLILLGYQNFIIAKAAGEYIQGKITLSEAAAQAELTVWEMEQRLIERGYKSSYSIEDLDLDLRALKRTRKNSGTQ